MRVPARWLSVQPTLPFRLDRNSRLRRMTTSLPSPRGLAMSSHVLVLRGSSTFESMTVCRMVPGCDQSYRLRSQKTPSRRNPSVTSAKVCSLLVHTQVLVLRVRPQLLAPVRKVGRGLNHLF